MTTRKACDPVTSDPVITVAEPMADPLDVAREGVVIVVSVLLPLLQMNQLLG